MSKIFPVIQCIIAAIVVSLLPLVACSIFDSIWVPGVVCFDIVLLLVVFFQKKLFAFRILLSVFLIVVLFATDSPYILATILFYLIVLWVAYFSFFNRVLSLIFFICCILFVSIADWSLFVESAFAMSLSELWGVARFFWWGIVAFIVVPVVQVAGCFLFSKELLCVKRDLSSLARKMILLVIALFGAHYALNDLPQIRVLDFSVYSFFKQQLQPGRISHSTYLQKDALDTFKIGDEKIIAVDSVCPTVMILVESWGVRKNLELNIIEFEVFNQNNVQFKGLWKRNASFTQAAEWEDFGMNRNLKKGKTLMEHYQNQSYDTWYLHGYDGNFYERNSSYDTLGFAHIKFREELAKENVEQCFWGNEDFEGLCDSSIANYIDVLLQDSVPKFIYWTTLDSHPPYATQKRPNSPICNDIGDDVACIHAVRIRNTLQAISNLASKHPEYRFILRGDHRPMGTLTSNSFITSFYWGWVPIIVLN
ncbi:MAG: sulfatase-like hydrolase/transferase [Fibrobacter sp.]|nr:sulfatase-like hydrolase/transferase [Fibrobacter sp.]